MKRRVQKRQSQKYLQKARVAQSLERKRETIEYGKEYYQKVEQEKEEE